MCHGMLNAHFTSIKTFRIKKAVQIATQVNVYRVLQLSDRMGSLLMIPRKDFLRGFEVNGCTASSIDNGFGRIDVEFEWRSFYLSLIFVDLFCFTVLLEACRGPGVAPGRVKFVCFCYVSVPWDGECSLY